MEEKNKRSERPAARMRDAQGRKGGGGSRETAIEESKETAVQVSSHQADEYVKPAYVTSSCRDYVVFVFVVWLFGCLDYLRVMSLLFGLPQG